MTTFRTSSRISNTRSQPGQATGNKLDKFAKLQAEPNRPRRQFLRALTASATASAFLIPLVPGLAMRAGAQETTLFDEEDLLQHVRGAEDAANVLIEYASLTCPHCARFHSDIYPRLEREWIDSGRLRFIYRHFPLDGIAVRAALLSECLVSDDAFFVFIDLLYRSQSTWARAEDSIAELVKRAALAGIDEEQARSCMEDEARIEQMGREYARAARELEVRGTPALFFNRESIRLGGDPQDFFARLSQRALDA
ncbi:MAG: DsbA family protein [Alphaproteobacteria bacterium]